MSRRRVFALLFPFFAAACVFDHDGAEADHHDDAETEETIGAVTSALGASSPVSAAVTESCSTTAVKALALQLVEEIQCLEPGSMKAIDQTPGLALGSAVFPYLQTSAANALIAAQKARGTTLSINSGLRTLPQQYLLYRWYQTGRCGIGLAARPGASNHESGIAVDINDNAGWRSAMNAMNFRWLGSSDPVHFDFKGTGTVDMKGLSVQAFQRLWNRNNPKDLIAEDGAYGPETEARLAKSPVGGFAIGASCAQTLSAPLEDTGGDREGIVPGAGSDLGVDPPSAPEQDHAASIDEAPTTITPAAPSAQGCAAAPAGTLPEGSLAIGTLAVLGLAARRARYFFRSR